MGLASAAAPFDEIFDDVAEEGHERVLDEAIADLEDRALRYCFARDIDELDEAAELYVRLGFGQSVEGFLEDRLDDLWRDVRDTAEDVVDGAGDTVDDVGDEVDDLF